jgi:hypothetical protein
MLEYFFTSGNAELVCQREISWSLHFKEFSMAWDESIAAIL